ncbi:MAG: hypothetical protein JXR63_07650, partial [Spirochaetales bacterium]|nr:hypothetical protein [Spirochaetales bacterium]
EEDIEKILEAYYIFNELYYENPNDEEVNLKLEEAEDALYQRIFFRNPIEPMIDFPLQENISFINQDSEFFRQVISIEKMYRLEEITYYANISIKESYISPETNEIAEKTFFAPYAKLVDTSLLFLNTNQTERDSVLSCKEVKTGEEKISIEITIPIDLIKFLSGTASDFKKLNLSNIMYIKNKYKFEDNYTHIAEIEIVNRIRKIFSLFSFPLIIIFLAFKNRPRYQHPEYGYSLFLPLIFGTMTVLVYLYYYFGEILYATVIVKLSFPLALLIMISTQTLLLSIAIVAILKFKKAFAAFLEEQENS